MTIRSFGQITPLQGHMLTLAGHGPSGEDGVRDLARVELDTQVIEQIRSGAKALERTTGEDFGYSLRKWHAFLVDDPALKKQYMRSLTWRSVSKAILREIDNPDRSRLEDLAQAS